MPVTQATNLVSTISTIHVDMGAMEMSVTFARAVDGVPVDTQKFLVAGESLAALLATQANAGQSLGDEITAAIYNYAVTNGVTAGTVS